jgi:hypothetical protein
VDETQPCRVFGKYKLEDILLLPNYYQQKKRPILLEERLQIEYSHI